MLSFYGLTKASSTLGLSPGYTLLFFAVTHGTPFKSEYEWRKLRTKTQSRIGIRIIFRLCNVLLPGKDGLLMLLLLRYPSLRCCRLLLVLHVGLPLEWLSLEWRWLVLRIVWRLNLNMDKVKTKTKNIKSILAGRPLNLRNNKNDWALWGRLHKINLCQRSPLKNIFMSTQNFKVLFINKINK